jgi:hypothetical protein
VTYEEGQAWLRLAGEAVAVAEATAAAAETANLYRYTMSTPAPASDPAAAPVQSLRASSTSPTPATLRRRPATAPRRPSAPAPAVASFQSLRAASSPTHPAAAASAGRHDFVPSSYDTMENMDIMNSWDTMDSVGEDDVAGPGRFKPLRTLSNPHLLDCLTSYNVACNTNREV